MSLLVYFYMMILAQALTNIRHRTSLNLLTRSPKKEQMQIICSGVDGSKVQLWEVITLYRTRISKNGLRDRIEMGLLL